MPRDASLQAVVHRIAWQYVLHVEQDAIGFAQRA
jgi:hypothetical protein